MMIEIARADRPEDPREWLDWFPAWRLPVAGDVLVIKDVAYEVVVVGFDPANAHAAVTIRPEEP